MTLTTAATEPPADEDDGPWSELRDVEAERLDAVGAGANGTEWFFAKQAEQGLFPAAYVHELLAEARAATPGETVTMTGSPAAIAQLIHGAAVRKTTGAGPAPYEELVKAKYNADDLKRLAASGAAMPDESYPIEDEDDLTKAVHAVGRGGDSHNAIRRHIITRAKALGKSGEIPDDWNTDGSLKEGPVSKTGHTVAKADGDADQDPGDLDLTEVLVDPDESVPGDPADPGSPAWESVDAATARKWTAVAVRIKNALGVMAGREMVEAVSADADDAWDAMDLEDAGCAMDYVISTLASFAVGEQATADLATEALDAIGKALHRFDTAPLDAIEVLVPVAKAGRVLSAANEQALRNAAAAIQQVLAALPAPVDETGQPVAKSKGTAMTTTVEEKGAALLGTPEQFAAAVMQSLVGLAKAKGDAVVAVYNADGVLAGTVDPADITPVADADTTGGDTTTDQGAGQASAEMTPDQGATVIPGTNTVAAPVQPGADDPNQVAKAMQAALAPLLTEVLTPIAKQLAEQAGLADMVTGLQEQVAKMAKMPDDRKSPLLNGGTGTAGIAGRDGSMEDPYAELVKAAEEATTPAAKRAAEQQILFAKVRDRFAR